MKRQTQLQNEITVTMPMTRDCVGDIRNIIVLARRSVVRHVNTTMTLAYWLIGRRIVVEDHIIKRNEAFGTLATARYTYKERVKVKGKWKTVTRTLTKTLEVNVDGSGVLVHDPVDGVSAYLHEDLWGSTYKKVGQKVFVTGKKKYKVYQSTVDVGGKSCPLTVKVTTAGKATVTLKWNTGKKKKGKWVYYTPSCSTVVYPTDGSAADPENFTGEVNYYFAPNANGFPGVGETVGVGVGY